MTDDIVARLRVLNHHAKKLAENESLHDLHREAFTRCENLTWEAAKKIERLREERDEARREVCGIHHVTGFLAGDYALSRGWDCFPNRIHKATQVEKDFRAWLEASDGGLLDTIDLLRSRCEHLETDRNNLELENRRLRAGGCARDQRTTQYCAEVVTLQAEIEKLQAELEKYKNG
jgi:DNA repair exonuclease SbcCD ATPase subunit